ncbi:helix-turn-helix domain-containing protein [Pedobacter mucosus]|uniref:helix-turn-helix domain-containing protein n=1 Tax=Pedobacter mucosus TaxID=2895286 RepID=UPI001EE46BDA|nr:helix-turn-helix domain-containing protein [Pedobacter mucosus]UKT64515.1 helix-turn-helix domain-containing protein [Pedobacter mucosus]
MIQTIIYTPENELKNYINYIAYREFDTLSDELHKPMPARHDIHMMFMIRSSMHDFINDNEDQNSYTKNIVTAPECVFSGSLTSYKGYIVFKGYVKLLVIHFKPAGFFWLFGISPNEIVNYLGNCSDFFSNQVIVLHNRLQEAKTPNEMFTLTNVFLLQQLKLNSKVKKCSSLLRVSDYLNINTNHVSIAHLAYESNMSLKTFERKFKEQIGLPPKLFERIKRFGDAIELKMKYEDISWTNICFKLGYFDQNHLIKDFTKFSGLSPSAFFKMIPPPPEKITAQ